MSETKYKLSDGALMAYYMALLEELYESMEGGRVPFSTLRMKRYVASNRLIKRFAFIMEKMGLLEHDRDNFCYHWMTGEPTEDMAKAIVEYGTENTNKAVPDTPDAPGRQGEPVETELKQALEVIGNKLVSMVQWQQDSRKELDALFDLLSDSPRLPAVDR
jgi:hypothetical protein